MKPSNILSANCETRSFSLKPRLDDLGGASLSGCVAPKHPDFPLEITVPKIVNLHLQAALLVEGLELFNKRTRLEARLAALDKLHDCMIEAAALYEINLNRKDVP